MPPQRQPAAKRRTAKRSFLPREEWAPAQGKKVRRQQLRQGIRGAAVIRPDRHVPRPRAARIKGRTGERISMKAKRCSGDLTDQRHAGHAASGYRHGRCAASSIPAPDPGRGLQPPKAASTSRLPIPQHPLPGTAALTGSGNRPQLERACIRQNPDPNPVRRRSRSAGRVRSAMFTVAGGQPPCSAQQIGTLADGRPAGRRARGPVGQPPT